MTTPEFADKAAVSENGLYVSYALPAVASSLARAASGEAS